MMATMFEDLLEAWDFLAEARGADPAAQRLGYRLARGLTRKAAEKPAAGPPPTPGTPAHAAYRRKTLVKSLGMKTVSAKAKKGPPPAPIPKGTKVAGVELGDSKNESVFAEALFLWEDCDCGCNGKRGGCGKGEKG